MRTLIISVLAVGTIGGAILSISPANAQEYPWCVQYGGRGGSNCGFVTWEQCMAARSGNGGYCYRNRFFRVGAPYAQDPHAQERPRQYRDRY
jgi:hypothetical protein